MGRGKKKNVLEYVPEHWINDDEKFRTVGLTEVERDCFDFCWIIKNFSHLTNEYHKSPEFDGGPISKHKWCLTLKPREEFENKKWMNVFLWMRKFDGLKSTDDVRKAEVTFQIRCIINGLNSVGKTTQTFEFKNDTNEFSWGWDRFIETPKNLPDDILKIQCKIWLGRPKISQKILKTIAKPAQLDEKNLAKIQYDFGNLLIADENLKDMDIKVDGHIFKVHKCILSVRSSVFSKMLSTQMLENKNSLLEVQDFDKNTVEKMIQYLYTGKTTITEDNYFEIFKISDKYDLADLRSECEVECVKNFTVQNALSALEFADKFCSAWLKARAIEFILKHKKEISKTKEFAEMLWSKNALLFDIMVMDME